MQVVQDDLQLCADCMIAAVNGDFTGLDYSKPEASERMAAIEAGLERLGHLVPDFDSESLDGCEEFAICGCDCCGEHLAGSRWRFVVLGAEP